MLNQEDNRESCPYGGEELLLLIYGEASPDSRAAMEAHIRVCRRCAREVDSFRATLSAVDASGLAERATRLAEEEAWGPALPGRLLATANPAGGWRNGASGYTRLAKAALVLLLAGASFAVGRYWDSLDFGPSTLFSARPSYGTGGVPGSPVAPPDSRERVRRFSEQTNDYLLRSHLVLLEVANADSVPASPGLKQASIGLLRDTKLARQVAGELDDERLQTLVAEIESVMREIASLSGSDDSESIDRVRAYLNNSGVLDQLEVMRMAPARLAKDRSRV